jgi:Protein of unknown function (DUF4446)
MDELTSTSGIVALGAAGLALLTLLLTLVLAIKLRRMRRAQSAVLGGEDRDLVGHAERLQNGFMELRGWVEDSMRRLDERMGEGERRLDGALAYRSLVRYDAYGEMSGRQSSSVALLDERRSGVVLSSILHRDQARIYVKQVHEGESELELSPEEREAVETALGAEQRV